MGGPVNMVDRDGRVISVVESDMGGAMLQGYRPQSEGERIGAAGETLRDEAYSGPVGKFAAAGTGVLRGATLGGSDVVFDALGGGDTVQNLREANPGTSVGAEILGSIATAFIPDGQFAPAGALAKAGASVARVGEGAGFLGRAGYAAAGAALEGGGQAGGSYLSQVALENKPLSAEAFVGAMGKGALFGGIVGGGLSVAESTLLRAKALFPQSQVTREAAQTLDRDATAAIRQTVDDGATMQQTARQKIEAMKLEGAQVDLAARKRVADLNVQRAQSQLERQQAMTDRAKTGPGRRSRKVFDEPPPEPGPTPQAAAPGTAAASDQAPTTLLDQLGATKSALDDGASLGSLSHAGDEALAAARPDAAKLVDAARKERMTRQEVQDWIANAKKGAAKNAEERGYSVSYERSLDGGKAPAGVGSKLDRVTTYSAETEASKLGRAKIESKIAPEDRLQILDDVQQMFGKGRSVGEQIVEGARPAATVDDQISAALRPHPGEHADIGDDLAGAAKKIGDHEEASAELAEALGADAPTSAAERAKAYRAATAQHADAAAAGSAQAADQLTNKLVPEVARRTGKAIDRGLIERLGDVGAGLEVLKAMGVNVPDVGSIPVIGPVLSLYLKARAALGVFKRAGGSVPKSVEAVVASKGATTRNRMNAAVNSMLDVGAAATRKAAPLAGPIGALGYKLLPGERSKEAKGDDLATYHQHMDDLTRARQPGAILAAVQKAVPTSDPVLQQEIAGTYNRMTAFLDSKVPRQMLLPTLLKGDGEWRPSKPALARYARYVEAAHDPAAVLEHVAKGGAVSIEAAETLRSVYPSLYREAQMTLVKRAQDMQDKLPYSRRVMLSVLFQVPVDGTMSQSHIQFLQQSAAAAQLPAQGSPAAAQPPAPTISGQVTLGERTMTSLDRRAGA